MFFELMITSTYYFDTPLERIDSRSVSNFSIEDGDAVKSRC
jgi:hypothetical protein